MSRYRKTFKEAMEEVQLNEVGYLQSKLNDRQIQNIKKIWQFKTKKDVTPAVIKMIKNMDPITQGAIKDAGINLLSDIAEGVITEGRMSEIDAMQKAGKTAAEIAKVMKLPVKTVKAILGEQETDSAQDMQDVKPGKDKIKEDEDKDVEEFIDDIKNNTPNSEQFDEEDEKEKEEDKKKKDKEDVAPDNDVPVETKKEKSDDKEKLKAEIEKKDNEIQSLKTKAETDKAKAVKKDTEKMVNPETGEPLLQIGVAYKHLKDKMAKEKKEEVELTEANLSKQQIDILKKEYEPLRGKRISAARAQQLMNILNKFKDSDLKTLSKANIPFLSSGSKSKLAVRGMKFTVKNINPFGESTNGLDEEAFNEACWKGYKQVGFKKKGGKQVPNCVPEEIEEGRFTKIHNLLIQKGRMQQANDKQGEKRTDIEIAKQKKMLGINEVLNKDDEKAIKPVIKQLKKSVSAHDKQAKSLEKAIKEVKFDFIKLRNGTKVLDKVYPNMTQARQAASGLMQLHRGTKADGYQSPFNNRFYVRIREENDSAFEVSGQENEGREELKEMKKDDAYAIGMAQAKKVMNDEPPLEKKTIKKGHEIADKILNKKENAPSEADIERLKKQGMKPKKEQKEHPAAAVYEQIKGLKNKAEKSGMPYSILKKVYDRGMAAWRGGHRPGTTQQQWAFARVNSFVTKSSGTWGGADKDLAKQVKGK